MHNDAITKQWVSTNMQTGTPRFVEGDSNDNATNQYVVHILPVNGSV